jgi:hypothetical protein
MTTSEVLEQLVEDFEGSDTNASSEEEDEEDVQKAGGSCRDVNRHCCHGLNETKEYSDD